MEQLGRYHLADIIATDELATTHRAYYVTGAGVARPVAVRRLLPAQRGHEDAVALLLAEGRVASRLDHPNVLAVLEVDRDEPFLVTERVLGRPLSELILRARTLGVPIDLQTAMFIVMELLEGLAHVHERTDEDGLLGIVHRDVCPASVWIGYDGRVKLGGLAYAKVRGHASPPAPGLEAPRYGYASPEQAADLDVDHRSDLFSAGLVLYELLAGRPPYATRARGEADGREVRALAERGEVRLLSEVAPHVGPELRALADRALAFDRRARPTSAAVFRDDLARVLHQRDPAYGAHQLAAFVARALGEESAKDRHAELEERTTIEALAREAPLVVKGGLWEATTTSIEAAADERPPPGEPEELTPPDPTPAFGAEADDTPPPVKASPVSAEHVPAERATGEHLPAEHVPAEPPRAARADATPSPAVVPPPPSAPAAVHGHAFEEPHLPIGKIALALGALAIAALSIFALSSPSNGRLVARRLRAAFVGRAPGGAVVIESIPPGAAVLLDQEDTGRKTPLTIENVESGMVHDVRLELPGEPAVTSTVSVRAGAKQHLTLAFPDAVVNLSVKTDPPGAELFVDDHSVALTPTSMMVRVGQKLRIRAARTGYVDYTSELLPERRKAIDLDVRLEPTEERKAAEALEAAEAEPKGEAPKKKAKQR